MRGFPVADSVAAGDVRGASYNSKNVRRIFSHDDSKLVEVIPCLCWKNET
jgi:hypothetical protein